MSREIDLTQPLSKEDKEYLQARARHDMIQENERLVSDSEVAEPEPVDDGNTGDVDPFTNDDGSDLLAGQGPTETPTTQVQAVESGMPPQVATEPTIQQGDALDDEDGDNYDDESVWSYFDLQAEAKDREGVSAAGSRADIIARLRADDAKTEDDSE